MEQYLVMPITITRGLVFEDYVFIPNPMTKLGQDLSTANFKAQLKYGSTLLGTFTCTLESPPDIPPGTKGWVKIRMDNTNTDSIPAGYTRGAWSLLASSDADNPNLIAGGPADIIQSATSW